MAKPDTLDYGPVVIEGWFDEDRIGNYDDDEIDEDLGYDEEDDHPENVAVVYEGSLVLSMHLGHYLIPYEHLRQVTSDDLVHRRDVLSAKIARASYGRRRAGRFHGRSLSSTSGASIC